MGGKIGGTAEFMAVGDRMYPFINAVREKGIVCMSQRCSEGIFYGSVRSIDMKRIRLLAEEYGMDLRFTSKNGLLFRLMKYRFRVGLPIGITALLLFVFYISNIVVSVEICGNKGVSRERIMSALSETGIYKGRLIADIDFHSCEQKLKLSIPELSWTGIRHTGSRIVVDVTEADPPPEMLRANIPCNIVADRDAQIVSIEVYSGVKMKAEGHSVKKGGMIISGVVDDGGGHTLKKHASGRIVGRYEETVKFVQPFSDNRKVCGGQSVKKYFEFFGSRFPLFVRKPKYETFDYSESTSKFMLFGKDLPLGIVHSSYTPFEYKPVSYSAEEADKLLQQKLTLHEKNFYDLKGIITEGREIKKKSTGDSLEYEVKFTLKGEVGVEQEIYVDR